MRTKRKIFEKQIAQRATQWNQRWRDYGEWYKQIEAKTHTSNKHQGTGVWEGDRHRKIGKKIFEKWNSIFTVNKHTASTPVMKTQHNNKIGV